MSWSSFSALYCFRITPVSMDTYLQFPNFAHKQGTVDIMHFTRCTLFCYWLFCFFSLALWEPCWVLVIGTVRGKGLNEGQWDRQRKSKPSESRTEHEIQAHVPQGSALLEEVVCSSLTSSELYELSWRLIHTEQKRRLLEYLKVFSYNRVVSLSELTHGNTVKETAKYHRDD